ncbi:MAG: hypothetical protein EXS15_08140 [Phycisphaerales bacterium]|nr:hypothetical protein [Phycisphaerales bacterium]
MESSKVAWGIEVGDFALKAIRLQVVDGVVTATDFAVMPHQRVLTDPSVVDRAGMIRITLAEFVQQHAEKLATEPIVMSLPGSVAFARFATIPSVNPKSMRNMIEYEAKQQIPFPIEEVEWDSHMLPADETGQCGIGIFAVTNERLQELLTLYAECDIEPDVLTLSSVAVYNAIYYDLQLGDQPSTEPQACIDIGTSSSDMVVMHGDKFWIRTFPVGGSHFTSAIADAFASQNVNYTRAEKIKVDRAPSEKVLRARTMAMRRVTGQLVDEIGRSREFYQASNDGVTLKHAYGVGSTLKISGLRTKIATDLQMTVDRLEEFKRIQANGPDAADFAAHSINLLTVVGLALQGIGRAKVELNLSPMVRIRRKVWKAKMPWFVAVAALLMITSAALFLRVMLDHNEISKLSELSATAARTIGQGESLVKQFRNAQQGTEVGNADINFLALLDDRNVWPFLVNDAYAALGVTRPAVAELGSDPERIRQIPAGDRRLIQLEEFSGAPSLTLEGQRRVTVSMRVTLTNKDPVRFFNEPNGVLDWFRANKDRPDAPYTIDISEQALKVPGWAKITGGKREEVPEDSTDTQPDSGGGIAIVTGDPNAGGQAGSGQGALTKKFSETMKDDSTGFRGNLGSGGQPGDDPNATGSDGASGSNGGAAGGARRVRIVKVSSEEKLPPLDLAKEAPLPSAPILLTPSDVQYEGIFKFTVTLRLPVATPATGEVTQ